jgi:hypothetical protein
VLQLHVQCRGSTEDAVPNSLSSLFTENGTVGLYAPKTRLYAPKTMVTATKRVIMWFNIVLQYGRQ